MRIQTTLLTVHKGVDLHAATAAQVMRTRLQGGHALVALRRAEYYTYWEQAEPFREAAGGNGPRGLGILDRMLATGRIYNPNKHHYGHFVSRTGDRPWHEMDQPPQGVALPAGWPGEARGSDWPQVSTGFYDRLLGGAPPPETMAVDICTFVLGESASPLAGVLWRLILHAGATEVAALADRLAVTRSGQQGLLVNPHMQGWLTAVRP